MVVLGQGRVRLDGPPTAVFGESEILAGAMVQPPQLTRLGQELGWPTPVLGVADFLRELGRVTRLRD